MQQPPLAKSIVVVSGNSHGEGAKTQIPLHDIVSRFNQSLHVDSSRSNRFSLKNHPKNINYVVDLAWKHICNPEYGIKPWNSKNSSQITLGSVDLTEKMSDWIRIYIYSTVYIYICIWTIGIILPDVSHFTLEASKLHPCLLPFVHPWYLPAMPTTIETFHRTKMYPAGLAMFNWSDQVMMHQTTKFRRFDVLLGRTSRDSVDRQNPAAAGIFSGMISRRSPIRVVKSPNSCSSLGRETLPWPKINLLGFLIITLYLFPLSISNTGRVCYKLR